MVSVIFIDFQLFYFLSRIIPYYKQYYNSIFKFSYFLLVPITECTGINVLTPETSTPGTESFSMSTLTALVTVKTELDYEVATEYVFVMEVEDMTTHLVGALVIKVILI